MARDRSNLLLIALHTPRWIGEGGLLDSILDALEKTTDTTPEKSGYDEKHLKSYSRAAALKLKPKTAGGEWFLMLDRERSPAYESSISSRKSTSMRVNFKEQPRAAWKPAYDLADALAAAVQPQVLAVSPQFARRDPAEGEDAETIDWIIESGYVYNPELRKHGLIGLSPRTYLGADVVQLIGRERIDSLSLPHEWLDWGGVRIDLIDAPWEAKPETIVGPWREAMAVLRPSEVFATGRATSPHGTVIPSLGKRWSL